MLGLHKPHQHGGKRYTTALSILITDIEPPGTYPAHLAVLLGGFQTALGLRSTARTQLSWRATATGTNR